MCRGHENEAKTKTADIETTRQYQCVAVQETNKQKTNKAKNNNKQTNKKVQGKKKKLPQNRRLFPKCRGDENETEKPTSYLQVFFINF